MRFSAIAFAAVFCTGLTPAAFADDNAAPAVYDAALAEELGADEYGMRSYIFVTLRTGPADAQITDKEKRAELFAGHFSNMGAMAKAGKLVLAGPVSGENNERGIFIFNAATIAEVETLLQGDPTVAAGIFTADYMTYYGSAALMKVNELHGRIQKTAIEQNARAASPLPAPALL